jgi:hypothetical protein
MGTKLFLLGILLLAFLRLSGQNDGVYLNMRLSIGSGADVRDDRKASAIHNEQYVTVSSTAGFEVNVQQMRDDDKINVINSSRGTVHEIFTIDQKMQKIMREMHGSSSSKSDYVFLTLISQ